MTQKSDGMARPAVPAGALVALLALAKFAIQMAAAGRYGIFRDELYYIACARHLAWGYVDQPPLIAGVTWVVLHVFGSSLYGLRLLPALAGAALVWVTAQIARELGGGRFAQGMAAFAVIPVPIYLVLDHWLTMNAFEPLLWMTALWLALRMVVREEPKYWLAIGAVCGVGLENKYSMALVAVALVVGLLLTPERRWLKNGWFAAGVGIAALIFLPNFSWLVRHGFPFLEFEHTSRMSGSRIERGPLEFVWDQMLIMNPVLAPLWVGGLLWLVRARDARRYRFLAWSFAGVFVALMLLKAKNYYVSPVYPVLFAAGAVALERVTAVRLRWSRSVYVATVLAAGAVLAPFVLPVLPVEEFLKYQAAFGGFTPVRFERMGPDLLPQQFSDEFGWEAMAKETGRVFATLSPEEQKTTAIFANDYGEAAAIDFFGAKYGLPQAIGNNESYWMWGPRDYTGTTVIVLGSDGDGDREHFKTVIVAGHVENRYARGNEKFDVLLCRDLNTDLRSMWAGMKRW